MKVVIDTETIATSAGLKVLSLKERMDQAARERKAHKAQRLLEKAAEVSLTPEQKAERARLRKVAELQAELASLQQ